MNKKILVIFTTLLTIFNFSSAKITTSKDINYYFHNMQSYDTPVYFTDECCMVKNSFLMSMPFKYENRFNNTFIMPTVRYGVSSIKDNLFRDIIVKNGDVFSFGFGSCFKDSFFAQFVSDFIMADTSYFLYKNMSFYNLDDFTKLSVDFPRFSYLSIRERGFNFLIGRTQLSSGPLEYDLLLSDNAPYYDNMSFKFNIFDDLYYRFSMISSVPFMSKDEYIYLFNHGITEGYRNDFFNAIYFFKNSFKFSIGTLNHVCGTIPQLTDIFVKSNAGLVSVNGIYNGILDLYGEYAINYFNFKRSYGFGVGKIFDFKMFKMRPYIEYYLTEKGIYTDTPDKSLFYRSIALSNTPGSRILFNYPFGFKYGGDSNVLSCNFIVGGVDGQLKIKYDTGLVNGTDLELFDFILKTKFLFGELQVGYSNLKFEEKFSSFNISYLINLDVGI